MKAKLYVVIGHTISGLISPNQKEKVLALCEKFLPYGSGFDAGVSIGQSKEDRIMMLFAYHHLNDGGYYSGWTYHTAIITPTFGSYKLVIKTSRCTGSLRKRVNASIDYFYDTIRAALDQEVELIYGHPDGFSLKAVRE